jgi:hypothetical protein
MGDTARCFLEMGATALMRGEAYRTWLSQGVSTDELTAIRQHLQRALGGENLGLPDERAAARTAEVRKARRDLTSSVPVSDRLSNTSRCRCEATSA